MLILASGSPRRRELLRLAGFDFVVEVSEADELVPEGISPCAAAELIAEKKAITVAVSHPDDTVIGADTIVVLNNKIMGKPADEAEAFAMLRSLSGERHEVITGVCVVAGVRKMIYHAKSLVEFYPLSDREIREYIQTGEPFDKAGAYGIQEKGGLLVKGIEGDFFNIVGLPIASLSRALQENFCDKM